MRFSLVKAAIIPKTCPLSPQTENDPTTAVYANVTDLKKTVPRSSYSSASTCSSPGIALSPGPDSACSPSSAGWQVHTDNDSGKEYFYHPSTGESSWSDPRSPNPGTDMESVTSSIPVSSPSSAHSLGSDWEKLLDETTGRHYYHNHASKKTSWTAPEPSSPTSSTDMAHSHGNEADEPVRFCLSLYLSIYNIILRKKKEKKHYLFCKILPISISLYLQYHFK